ncbi:segregation and condensation protein B [Anaerocolumna chitinilytica]|uniref:Segregation and condensation protein B n=2 Tax=Anaerocolumna chitinilytica TaxID=1727145 RepID=A0A7I8DN88_9FIRM|nr:segregation and condensation protein B [Anaerocolumna chitinilytica]
MIIYMEINQIKAAIEAILFTMGEAVELERLSAALGHDKDTVKRILHSMMDDYDKEERGVRIIELEDSYQMCTKTELYESLIKITHIPKKHILTDVLLETLSIIAYKQPITRIEIEAIRGVKSDHAVNKLIEYNLVGEVGRMDAPGRPILFGTTEEFLRSFGIHSLEDLPIITSDKVEDFKLEAEEEVQLRLDI